MPPLNYLPTAVKLTAAPLPQGGELRNTASVNNPMKRLADGIAYGDAQSDGQAVQISDLLARTTPLASLAALTAIAAPANNVIRFVAGFGEYVFQSASTLAALTPYVLVPNDATPGRWVRGGVSLRTETRTASLSKHLTLFDPNTQAPDKGALFCASSRTYKLIGGVLNQYDWVGVYHGILSFLAAPDTATGVNTYGVQIPIDEFLDHGATLTQVVVRAQAAIAGRSSLPTSKFKVGVFVAPNGEPGTGDDVPVSIASLTSAGDFVEDPSADVVAYEQQAHSITVTCDQNNVVARDFAAGNSRNYVVQVWNEAGGAGTVAANNKIHSVRLTMSNANALYR